MTYLLSTIKFTPSDRLFESLRLLCTFNASIVVSTFALSGKPAGTNHIAIYQCKTFNLDLHIPTLGPMEMAIQNRKPGAIDVTLAPPQPWPDDTHETQHPFVPMVVSLACMIFADFYEAHREWMESNAGLGANAEDWPPIFNFARVIRNAVSHGGKIHFKNPKAKQVKWHSFQYSPSDQGRPIFAKDLFFPELFLLMLDFSRALDRHGAPRPA